LDETEEVVWLQGVSDSHADSLRLVWSSATHNEPQVAALMDEVLCPVERSMGSGYRKKIAVYFPSFLSARGRRQTCLP
jgi:hypothetical protein